MKCYLMNKNTKVALIEYNLDLNVINDIHEQINIDYAPLAITNALNNKSKSLLKELNNWFRGRGIPSWRKNIENLLENLGINTTDELLNQSYALSLSDQYWIKDFESDIEWEHINFFDNEFEFKAFLDASLRDTSTINPNLKSPNNTTDGMLQKAWVIYNGKRILIKGTYTASNQEPINEWLASQICNRLGFKHCSYEIDYVDHKIVSKCENFVSADEEIISAYDIYNSCSKKNTINDFTHYVNILEKHNLTNARKDIENMILIDFLMMNTDRHMKNFGVIRDVNTLEWKRVAPIFDTGQSMNCDEVTRDVNFNNGYGKFFTNTRKSFHTYLDHVEDLSRFDLNKLNGLDKIYRDCLIKYQEDMDMSKDRIDKLVNGLQQRIQLLEKELQKSKDKDSIDYDL